MPFLKVTTNVKAKPDFIAKAVDLVASALSKSKSYVAVSLNHCDMNWGGSTDPAVIAELGSIGQIGAAINDKTSAALTSFFVEELGVNQNRIYITFCDLKKENVGYSGTTFAKLM